MTDRRWSSMAVILVMVATSAFAQEPRGGVALRGDRSEVESRYREISQSTSLHDRKEIFQTLSPELRADLWLLHLQTFLVGHPELTGPQRDVIVEGIGILATELPGSVDGLARHYSDERLQRFSANAATVLPRALFLEAFAQLGPSSNLKQPTKRDKGEQQISADYIIAGDIDCTCSHTDNFCNSPTSPTPYCNRQMGCRPLASGCGWWWQEVCDGYCGTVDG